MELIYCRRSAYLVDNFVRIQGISQYYSSLNRIDLLKKVRDHRNVFCMAVVTFGLLLFLPQSAEELFVTFDWIIWFVTCWLKWNFTVFSAHRRLVILLNRVNRHLDLVKYYPVFRNTAEANDCGRIKPTKFFFSAILASNSCLPRRLRFFNTLSFGRRSFPPSTGWYFPRFVTRAHDVFIGQIHTRFFSKQRRFALSINCKI